MKAWKPKPKIRKPIHRRAGFKRWQQKCRQRREAYIAAHLRNWHIENESASRQWYRNDPIASTVNRQSQRAKQYDVPVNRFNADEWEWLLDACGHRCAYCGKETEQLTPDHVVPLSQGGANSLSNIVPACETCNKQKGAKTPEESGMELCLNIDVTRRLEQLALI
jgi:5-methylcytosine-specific restriction endonuclease McrA